MVRPLSNINLTMNRAQLVGPAFSPDDIANLTWWVDPDDGDTVTLSGSEIITIDDKVAGTSNSRLIKRNAQPGPLLATSNGRDWMSGDGATSGRCLNVSDSTLTALLPGTGEFSLYVVVSPAYTGTGTEHVMASKGFTGWYSLRSPSTPQLAVVGYVDESGGAGFRTAGPSAADVLTQNGRHIVRFVRDNTAGEIQVYVDGVEVASVNFGTLGALDDTAEKFCILCRASGATQTSFWNGLIGETLFFKDVLSTADNAALEAYLATKWGTA